MSDGAAILAYYRYFLSCLWFSLTRAREAKVVKEDLATDFIRVISAGVVSV